MQERNSIMPECPLYSTTRFNGSHKHHIFGAANRNKSEEYGLFVFLTPALHNMSDKGVHFNKELDTQLKQIAQQTAMDYYGWTIEDFIKKFGRNYL